MVVGQGREYLSALIEINFDAVSEWALANNVSYTGIESLSQQPAITKLIGLEIEKANQKLTTDERIQSFRMIPKVLDPGGDDEQSPQQGVEEDPMNINL
jgi:long-chain acyl-CoA synthetase